MTLIQYILFANLYLMVFWVAYRLWLHKLTSFGGVRLYLNLALMVSALLPLAQWHLSRRAPKDAGTRGRVPSVLSTAEAPGALLSRKR